jgi:hypothetical protein
MTLMDRGYGHIDRALLAESLDTQLHGRIDDK